MTVQGEQPYDLQRLEQRARPLTVHHARVTESTNDWAKREMQAGGVQTPALFVADSQTAGRGRRGNAWWSPRGNIAATFAFSHDPHLAFGLLPLLAGLAVRRALADLSASEEIGLKWPNDLIARQRKVAGLLCERLQGVDLLGIGVNVNGQTCVAPTELRGESSRCGSFPVRPSTSPTRSLQSASNCGAPSAWSRRVPRGKCSRNTPTTTGRPEKISK